MVASLLEARGFAASAPPSISDRRLIPDGSQAAGIRDVAAMGAAAAHPDGSQAAEGSEM